MYTQAYAIAILLFLIAIGCTYLIELHRKKNFLSLSGFRGISFIAFVSYIGASVMLFATL